MGAWCMERPSAKLDADSSREGPAPPFTNGLEPFFSVSQCPCQSYHLHVIMDFSRPIDDSQPLDLSTSTPSFVSSSPTRFTVIQSASVEPFTTLTPTTGAILPTCSNPNLNSNWIAMKFGAAVGPNRMSYPREFKLMVIDYYYANGHNKYRTCKEFQITKSMLNGWLQKIDKIRQSRPGSLKSGRSGRRPQFPDIEKQLYALYMAHLGSGQKVGNRWIRETARALAQQQCSQAELAGMCQFSERWLSNFKKRYRINLNRDWSSGASQGDSSSSSAISTDCSVSPQETPQIRSSTMTTKQLDSVSDASGTTVCDSPDDLDGEDGDDDDDGDQNHGDVHSMQSTLTQAILDDGQPGQLPIHAFYKRFPWLCRRSTNTTNGYEPGRRGRKVQFPQVEKVLHERLMRRQQAGHRVSNRWLQNEARALAAQLCPEILAQATKSARCMFSEHWLHNFKKRFDVSLKQRSAVEGTTVSVEEVEESRSSTMNANQYGPNAMAAAVFQMQQWFLHQCYLSSLIGNTTAIGNSSKNGDHQNTLPTMVPLPTLAQSVQALQKINQSNKHIVGESKTEVHEGPLVHHS